MNSKIIAMVREARLRHVWDWDEMERRFWSLKLREAVETFQKAGVL